MTSEGHVITWSGYSMYYTARLGGDTPTQLKLSLVGRGALVPVGEGYRSLKTPSLG
jgi:hypothetical protein